MTAGSKEPVRLQRALQKFLEARCAEGASTALDGKLLALVDEIKSMVGESEHAVRNYGQNFSNYAENFSNYAENFSNYAENFSNYAQNFSNYAQSLQASDGNRKGSLAQRRRQSQTNAGIVGRLPNGRTFRR